LSEVLFVQKVTKKRKRISKAWKTDSGVNFCFPNPWENGTEKFRCLEKRQKGWQSERGTGKM